jgi:choice-of-anchor C domain-containing protein
MSSTGYARHSSWHGGRVKRAGAALALLFGLLVVVPPSAHAAAAPANLVTNGSFEQPDLSPSCAWSTYGAGSTQIAGWTVVGGSVDLHVGQNCSALWATPDGTQAVDLNGLGRGLKQNIATDPGQVYLLSFWMSGNGCQSQYKTLDVKFDGNVVGTPSHDRYPYNIVYPEGWELFEYTVAATSSISELSFVSTSNISPAGWCGPAIDDVRLVAVPTPLQSVMSAPAFDQSVFAGSYITSGEGSTINGDALAGSYLTTGASATIDGDSVAVAAVTLGAGATVSGNVESGAAITAGAGVTVNGSETPDSTGPTVTAAQQDVLDAQNFLNGLPPTSPLLPGNIATDVTFTPGVRNVAGLLTLAAGKTIYLDAQDDSDAVFIFSISDYLTFGAGANVEVINGGSNARVIWNVTGGYVTVGAGANVVGTVMAYGYVSTGAEAVLSGVGASCGGVYSVASYVSIGASATVGTPGC